MWHTRTHSHFLINVCDRFLERIKLIRSGARPGRELFITRPGLGAHGGANGLVPLLLVSLCEHNKAVHIALGERHAEKCAMRKTLTGGLVIVSAAPERHRFPLARELEADERRIICMDDSGDFIASQCCSAVLHNVIVLG